MTTKTLLGIVAGVFIIFIGAYIVMSPADNRTVDTSVSETTSADITVTPSAPTQTEGASSEASVSTPTTAPSSTPTTEPTTKPTTVASYTTADVALHNNQSSCWTIVEGKVYDLTSFITKHPGGAKRILGICGIDGTAAFTGQHSGDARPQETITGYEIGIIK